MAQLYVVAGALAREAWNAQARLEQDRAGAGRPPLHMPAIHTQQTRYNNATTGA